MKELQLLGVNFAQNRNRNIPAHLLVTNEINNFFLTTLQNAIVDPILLNKYLNAKLVSAEFEFHFITEAEVYKIVKSVKSNASGYDGISLKLILYSLPVILSYITHIINVCIEENRFPDACKIAVVTPIPKLSTATEYKDLRPISVLPLLSKVLEKIMESQLLVHINKYHLLPATQSGFHKGYACETALLHVTDNILNALDNNKFCVLILLDLSRAFDTLDHSLLLSILHYIGLASSATKMFKSYLTGRNKLLVLLMGFLKVLF